MARVLWMLTAVMVAGAWGQEVKVVGGNLVKNGGFEEGKAEWTGGGWSMVADPVHSGQQACRLAVAGEAKQAAVYQKFVPIKPFTNYRVSVALRRTNGDGYVYVHCNWYKSPTERLMISKTWPAQRAVPVTSRTGEDVGRWVVKSGYVRTERPDAGGIQLVIFIRGTDTIYVDDVVLEEVQLPPAPDWKLPDAVLFPGAPSRYHMAVEKAAEQNGKFAVTTTGADYLLDPAGTMTCGQRIGATRRVAEVKFARPLGQLRIVKQNADVCVVQGDDLAFGFQGDALVTVATNRDLELTVTSGIGARHYQLVEPHLLAIDERGGFCVMPHARPLLSTPGTSVTPPETDVAAPGWSVKYRVGARELLGLAVFPGKPFDWATSFQKRIVNTSDCPEPEALREFAKHANVLFLFGHIYRDQPGGATHAPYAPRDEAKLKATIKLAHELGMQVICYRHPTSYSWVDTPLEEGLEDMLKWRREYGFDGWYLDGYPSWHSWYDSYWFMRALRQDIGDAIMYTHCTLNPPQGMVELYAPFIDSYSDFLLRGEGQAIQGTRSPYLRYVIGTQHVSNAIATLKGDKMVAAPGSEEKVSLHDQLAVLLKLNGRCRWAYPSFPYRPADLDDYLGFYFQELDRQQAEWEQTGRPPEMTWP